MTQLECLKIRLDNENNETLLQQLLDDAEAEILDYCNRTELKPIMYPLQRELAIIFYNRKGDEGASSKSEGAISVSYEIPDNIKSRLNQYRRLKIVGVANANKE